MAVVEMVMVGRGMVASQTGWLKFGMVLKMSITGSSPSRRVKLWWTVMQPLSIAGLGGLWAVWRRFDSTVQWRVKVQRPLLIGSMSIQATRYFSQFRDHAWRSLVSDSSMDRWMA